MDTETTLNLLDCISGEKKVIKDAQKHIDSILLDIEPELKTYLIGHDDGSYGHEDKMLLVRGIVHGEHDCLEVAEIVMVLNDLNEFRPIENAFGLKEGINFHYYEL